MVYKMLQHNAMYANFCTPKKVFLTPMRNYTIMQKFALDKLSFMYYVCDSRFPPNYLTNNRKYG